MIPVSLATRSRTPVASRIWVMLPGDPWTWALYMVWMESMMARRGFASPSTSVMASRSVSHIKRSRSEISPIRLPRILIWRRDSSPEI